jgi:hypothetical protein
VTVKIAENYRYLGIMIDRHLHFGTSHSTATKTPSEEHSWSEMGVGTQPDEKNIIENQTPCSNDGRGGNKLSRKNGTKLDNRDRPRGH